jgi:hypothetical protein
MISRSNSASAPKTWNCIRPPGVGGVDLLGQRAEPDLAVVQLFDELDEMFEPAAEPVQSPDHERVAGGEELEAGVELGAVLERPGADVVKHAAAAGLLSASSCSARFCSSVEMRA